MKRVIYYMVLGVVLSAFVSCRAISDFFGNDPAVAAVGKSKLRLSELRSVIPDGIAPEDSARLAAQYMKTWALDKVFLEIAQKQLSKSEKDVARELEDYRTSLHKYRYEQLYVNERLDTSVAEEEVLGYYERFPEKFVLQRPVVKARFMSIPSESPLLKPIKDRMCSSEAGDVMAADSMAFSAAFKFTTWDDEWIDIAELAWEFGPEYASVMASVKPGWIERTDTSGVTNVAYVSNVTEAGRCAPIEFSTPLIKDMIISARKQGLISDLERDLLNDARENGQFVIL